jgi:transcriptional regulator with XRE-family HTH domain
MAGRADPGQRAAIRHLRARYTTLGFNQKQFAKASGVPERTLQRLEEDKGWARAATLEALEKAIGEPTGYLDEYAARYNEDAAKRANSPDAEEVADAIDYLSAALERLKRSALPGD